MCYISYPLHDAMLIDVEKYQNCIYIFCLLLMACMTINALVMVVAKCKIFRKVNLQFYWWVGNSGFRMAFRLYFWIQVTWQSLCCQLEQVIWLILPRTLFFVFSLSRKVRSWSWSKLWQLWLLLLIQLKKNLSSITTGNSVIILYIDWNLHFYLIYIHLSKILYQILNKYEAF